MVPKLTSANGGSPSATNRSTGAVTTSVILMTFHGTSEGARPETEILTVVAVLPRAVADTWVRKPGAADLAKATAAAAPGPGGCLDVLATSAPCWAAANAVSRARYHTDACTTVMIPSKKTGTTIT